MSFAKLDALCRSLEALEHAQAILGADEATNMAVGGGEKRAEAMAHLAGLHHRRATAPEVAEWIADARNEHVNDDQAAAIREFERHYKNLTCLPTEFVERQSVTRMRCEQVWRDLRTKGDWSSFMPALERVVALAREEAAMRADVLGLAPYDAMIEQFDPGLRVADIDPVFSELKTFLTAFVPSALKAQEERLAGCPMRDRSAHYSIERQRELGLAAMAAVGFDFMHGSLSVSHHPFCGGVPSDVRITTRYRTDEFVSALMGTLHETGHALYEQNLPASWSHWPSGKARGMAMHESQSLFVEKQLGRNPAFWHFLLPLVEVHLGERWTKDEILGHVLHMQRGLIRVDADEVTYPLHIILRYELEQDLLGGGLAVADLPEAWDAKMTEYLGLSTIDNPADGPMQDVHWPSGAFGYFPSYTLGAILAAQQWAAIARENRGIAEEIAVGNFDFIHGWLRANIWSRGSFRSTAEIVADATGEPLNAQYFMDHLSKRYGDVPCSGMTRYRCRTEPGGCR
jgi:carboxypeptidase Taq